MPVDVKLQRVLSQVPITALEFSDLPSGKQLVLAGQDNEIEVFDTEARQLICKFRIFDEQTVHGLSILPTAGDSPGKLLIWGAKLIAIVSTDGLDTGRVPSVVATATAPDWIYSGAFSPYDRSRACLVTAHNEAVLIRYEEKEGQIILEEVIAPARPGLYSASLTWLAADCVLVAAGTVFGEILVWKAWTGVGRERLHELLYVLTGHEGSIFGVDISPSYTIIGGRQVRLLATSSDDRTIRIWDISEKTDAIEQTNSHFSTARETGFGGDEANPTLGSRPPVALAMGHLSRIWGVKFSAATEPGILGTKNTLDIYSFGEDATTQCWKMEFHAENVTEIQEEKNILTGTLTLRGIYPLHEGKHLWSRAVSSSGNKQVIATGGADSRISLIEAHMTESEATSLPNFENASTPSVLVTVDIPKPSDETPQPKKKRQEIIGQYDFISDRELVAATSHGRLLLGTARAATLEWKEIQVEEVLHQDVERTYVLKQAAHGIAVLGATSGSVLIYHLVTDRLFRVASLPGKIVGITCLSTNIQREASGAKSLDILVHLYGASNPTWLKLSATTGDLLGQVEVSGLDPKFVTASASTIGQFLMIGSRHGWMSVLAPVGNGYQSVCDIPPRSPDAICAIVALPRSQDSQDRVSFLTTGRDGKFRIYEIVHTESVTNLELLHESSPPFGPMIEGAWFTDGPQPELILYGFRSKCFVVWNETRREERASVDCGGAHRSFSFLPGRSDRDPFFFTFTKTSTLFLYYQRRPMYAALKTGIHGREVRTMTSAYGLTATGAEDTTIRIWEHPEYGTDDAKQMKCLTLIKAHQGGIQRLAWSPLNSATDSGQVDSHLFSSAGSTEFFVWRIRSLRGGYSQLGVTCEGIFDETDVDKDLRIMDFSVQPRQDGIFIITMAFSNSFLSTYVFDKLDGFKVLARGAYTGACLTQVQPLTSLEGIIEASENEMAVLTASTDGHIVTWKIRQVENQQTKQWVLNNVTKVHQNSIKCLALVPASEGQFYVVTGGDDNSLGVSMLSRDIYQPVFRHVCRRAHAAAINGLAVKRVGESLVVFTASNDQRLKAWTVSKDGRICLQADMYSGVADPGDIEILPGQNQSVALGGVGLELWKTSLPG
ncbi:unnamed protein product [Clonostachys rosea]|uniref:Anaphase-promoting complex subunit 4 WD40 domain-containing protein n=1 Tax=Bionectria ochroleuca TaxID=29856 RepID=A0ABY6UEU1_BIOOC|nr:unnamed protein product [Clonostachys rosea]